MENTNSKSKRSIALLLALCMLTSFCSYTIAKYMTIGEGNDFSRVAKWGITFDKGSSEMFATTYNTGVISTDKVVAPGTSGSGTYILEGTPETAYEITFNTEGTSEVFLGKGDWKYIDTEGYSDLMNYNNSETGTNEIYYPIKYTVTLANTVGTINAIDDTIDVLAENTPTVFDSFTEAAKVINNTKVTFNPNDECDAKITVDWAWAFDGQNDAADTILGDLAAKNPDLTNVATAQEGTDYNVNISYKFSLTAKQITIEPDILSKGFKNKIPDDVTTLIFDDYSNYPNVGTSTASTFSLEPATLNAELDNNSENNENVEENEIQLLSYKPEIIGIIVDENNTGNIQLFIENHIAYILNMKNRPIYAPENSSNLFSNMNNLTTINLETLNTSKVTNMDNMFKDCSSLEKIYISNNWKTNKVESSENMFEGAVNLPNYDENNLNIKNNNYFTDIDELTVLSNTISNTFKDNIPDTVTTIIFDKYKKYESIVSSIEGINVDSKGNGNIKLFIDDEIAYILSMNNKTIFAPKDSSNLFFKLSNLKNIKLNNLNTSKVTNMTYIFANCENLTSLDLSNFDTSNVTDMYGMFMSCKSLTSLNINNLNTSNVTNMSGMFSNCENLTSLDLSNFDTSNVTDMGGMFSNCENLTSLDVNNFDTSNVTNMGGMFSSLNITSLDISNFNTSNVTNMTYMFYNSENLISLDLSNFDTYNVKDMSSMFNNCNNLKLLDLSNFNTSNVSNMYAIFSSCTNLTTIYVSDKWNINNVKDSTYMFNGCLNLAGNNGTKFNSSYIDKTYARIDTPETPGYLTLKTN